MNSLATYCLSFTNYKLYNDNNVNNFIIELIQDRSDDDIKKHLQKMKLLIGIKFFESFLIYLRKKDPNNKILSLSN